MFVIYGMWEISRVLTITITKYVNFSIVYSHLAFIYGALGVIRTRGFQDLQSRALGLSATVA